MPFQVELSSGHVVFCSLNFLLNASNAGSHFVKRADVMILDGCVLFCVCVILCRITYLNNISNDLPENYRLKIKKIIVVT